MNDKQKYVGSFPRRNMLTHMVQAEKAILQAVREVEDLGADTLLTDAVIKLMEAKELVADFIDKSIGDVAAQDASGGGSNPPPPPPPPPGT